MIVDDSVDFFAGCVDQDHRSYVTVVDDPVRDAITLREMRVGDPAMSHTEPCRSGHLYDVLATGNDTIARLCHPPTGDAYIFR